jgi:hypothetical protein
MSSYRFSNSFPARAPQPSLRTMMTGLLVGFVVVSLLVFLFGRVPFTPGSTPLDGPSYKEYVANDTELLTTYGRTPQGSIHIPIDRAMDLIAQRGLPTRENPSPTP